MRKTELEKFMTFNRERKARIPLAVFTVNDTFIVAAYQGSLSKYDMLIKYRQRLSKEKWSLVRTPKHIHWAVDMLIKMYEDKEQTQKFLEFLIDVWNKTTPIRSEEDRSSFLSIENLLEKNRQEIEQYGELSKKGEYNVKFLILLAKLLMAQEKTNLETAYMFKRLLDALRSGEDIFKIVSIASHVGRR